MRVEIVSLDLFPLMKRVCFTPSTSFGSLFLSLRIALMDLGFAYILSTILIITLKLISCIQSLTSAPAFRWIHRSQFCIWISCGLVFFRCWLGSLVSSELFWSALHSINGTSYWSIMAYSLRSGHILIIASFLIHHNIVWEIDLNRPINDIEVAIRLLITKFACIEFVDHMFSFVNFCLPCSQIIFVELVIDGSIVAIRFCLLFTLEFLESTLLHPYHFFQQLFAFLFDLFHALC